MKRKIYLFCLSDSNNAPVTVTLAATTVTHTTPTYEFSSGVLRLSQNKEEWIDLRNLFFRVVRMYLSGIASANCPFPPAESRLVLLHVHHKNHGNIQKSARQRFVTKSP